MNPAVTSQESNSASHQIGYDQLMSEPSDHKHRAFTFLTGLRDELVLSLPAIDLVAREVELAATANRGSSSQAKVLFKEGAFVTRFVTPVIHKYLTCYANFDSQSARDALISENSVDRKNGYANAKAKTAYPFAHPFGKSIGEKAIDVVNKWYTSPNPLSTKHPDLCITQPFRILIEAKYLLTATPQAARIQLVETIYQSFFYLGLASVPNGKRTWEYEFAVALIYDGSRAGSLVTAWNELPSKVRRSLWDSANIFVMALRGIPVAT